MDADSWRIRGGFLSRNHPCVMGILNVTPDSFSDGGWFNTPEKAAAHARRMATEGAALLDIGAQSTRPGAQRLSAAEEWERLQPCLQAVLSAVDLPISVDTFWPEVADKALRLGAHIINDVSGSEQNGMAAVAAAHGAGMIFMRSGSADDRKASAEEVLAAAREYFSRVPRLAAAGGLPPQAVCVDIGIGFGSSTAGDKALLSHLRDLSALCPAATLLVGVSRKRVVRELFGDTPDAVAAGNAVLHVQAVQNGAHILRAHDVAQTMAAIKTATSI